MALGTAVGGRPDRDTARIPHPPVPPPARPPRRQGHTTQLCERDYIALLDSVHQLVKAPIVLVWDRLNTHVSKTMQQLIAAREWLTVFLLPAYSP
jgi:hypothetical protein